MLQQAVQFILNFKVKIPLLRRLALVVTPDTVKVAVIIIIYTLGEDHQNKRLNVDAV